MVNKHQQFFHQGLNMEIYGNNFILQEILRENHQIMSRFTESRENKTLLLILGSNLCSPYTIN